MSEILVALHVHTLAQQLSYAFLIPCVLFVFWRGGRPERWVIAAMAAAWVATPFTYDFAGLVRPAISVMAIDAALFAGLLWVALRSDRYWPLVTTGLHLLGVVLHLAIAVDPEVGGRARVSGSYILGYLTVFSVVVGAAIEAPRRPSRPRSEAAGGA